MRGNVPCRAKTSSSSQKGTPLRSKVHLRRMVFKFTGPLERNLFSREEGERYGVGWVGIRGGTKKEKGGGSEKEKRDKAAGGGRGGIKREERGWFSWGGAAAEWRGWSSLFIDFRSALVARTCIRGLDALFVPPQRFSFTLGLPRSPSFLE